VKHIHLLDEDKTWSVYTSQFDKTSDIHLVYCQGVTESNCYLLKLTHFPRRRFIMHYFECHYLSEWFYHTLTRMLESNLSEGNQKTPTDLELLKYGVSVTDGCISWDVTVELLEDSFNINIKRFFGEPGIKKVQANMSFISVLRVTKQSFAG